MDTKSKKYFKVAKKTLKLFFVESLQKLQLLL